MDGSLIKPNRYMLAIMGFAAEALPGPGTFP